jgi:hypothetical protein
MKVELKKVEPHPVPFKPFTVTVTLESEDEANNFFKDLRMAEDLADCDAVGFYTEVFSSLKKKIQNELISQNCMDRKKAK